MRSLDRLKEPDGSLGGVRFYSDDEYKVGEKLELELVLPDGSSMHCVGQVAWVRRLSSDEWACFQVGFAFIEGAPEALDLLKKALDPNGPGGPGRPGGSGGGPRRPANQASLGVRGYRAGWKSG
jgi:hypothetical protein